MKKSIVMIMAAAAFGLGAQSAMAGDIEAGKALFTKKCNMCHKKAPGIPLAKMSSDRETIVKAISEGRKGTMMKSWSGKLNGEQIESIADYIMSVPREG